MHRNDIALAAVGTSDSHPAVAYREACIFELFAGLRLADFTRAERKVSVMVPACSHPARGKMHRVRIVSAGLVSKIGFVTY